MRITAHVEDAIAGLNEAQRALNHPEPGLALVGMDVRRDVERHWESEGGGDWPRLAPSTLARKVAGGGTLERTGALRASVTGAPRISRDGVTFSTSVPYARYLEGRFPLYPDDVGGGAARTLEVWFGRRA